MVNDTAADNLLLPEAILLCGPSLAYVANLADNRIHLPGDGQVVL